ncbi:L-serine ammonia-lyase, iron-sulfur-dependent, subunit alpha [Paenibacillus sp. IB182496]|uniref:L-serine dehydratase n=1 Tax=Paenibacillus sabuli TaxID=2772509 RepID=A0A927GQ21_9BACL|nr:L-serine ammonia-lyase, iron-sulfur-dependent, subunit alpha [Paenibacillus sabuli]MBD2843826.1 L-serine ammonia-lyase, iron-sulfur-dependent, subunit alpha [Paenibacillus sabuli]
MRFQDLQGLAALCIREGLPIHRLMLEEQARESGRTVRQEKMKMTDYYRVMKEAVRRGLTEDTRSRSGLTGNDAKQVEALRESGAGMLGPLGDKALAYALAVSEVNASMGRIIATPTAGSCGVIPGVFVSAQEEFGWSDERMTEGLFTAGALGYVIANRSFVSGAEGGCQAEIGSAVAMAAGALAELRGGTPEQAVHAVGLALKNSLGLVCDPVGGLVEVPCIVRNGFGAVSAITAAQMALAGVRSAIPSDEVIEAMREVGGAMPDKYRETARGGLAATKTGKRIMEELHPRRHAKREEAAASDEDGTGQGASDKDAP